MTSFSAEMTSVYAESQPPINVVQSHRLLTAEGREHRT